ncbi:MAG: hypothetical protein FWC67_05360, partial [Defluviitaleaceae bacterium]|nr:hypothetical protein [Defluviitaleaceae bacterium]
MHLNDDITVLKNVGESRKAMLQRLGIETIGDILEFFPRDYLDRSKIYRIAELFDGQMATLLVWRQGEAKTKQMKGKTLTRIHFSDGTGHIGVSWFNQPYMATTFKANTKYFFSGRVSWGTNGLFMDNPEWELCGDGYDMGGRGGAGGATEGLGPSVAPPAPPRPVPLIGGEAPDEWNGVATVVDNQNRWLSSNRIVPVYRLTGKITQKILRPLIRQALDIAKGQIKDYLPEEIRQANGLCSLGYAIENIHFPAHGDAYFAARHRLVFDEFFLMQAALASAKGILKRETTPDKIFHRMCIRRVLASFPYELTGNQKKAIDEIMSDIASGYTLNRLLQGDVGSGKTAVAQVICYLTAKNNKQAAL